MNFKFVSDAIVGLNEMDEFRSRPKLLTKVPNSTFTDSISIDAGYRRLYALLPGLKRHNDVYIGLLFVSIICYNHQGRVLCKVKFFFVLLHHKQYKRN